MATARWLPVALVAVLAALVPLVVWLMLGVERSPARANAGAEQVAVRHDSSAEVPDARDGAPTAPVSVAFEAAPVPQDDDASTERTAERPDGEIDVLVREQDGAAVADVDLEIASESPPHPEGYPVQDERGIVRRARTDAAGRARFDGIPAGAYRLAAISSDGRRVRRSVAVYLGREPVDMVLPRRREPWELTVHVVGVDGTPVAEARVEATGHVVGLGLVGMKGRDPLVESTDSEGVARFAGREFRAVALVATAPDGRTGSAYAFFGERASVPRVVVGAAGALEGSLIGLPAASLTHARVRAHLLTGSPYSATVGPAAETTAVDGRYRFDALAAGKWTLELVDPGGARLVLPLLMKKKGSVANSIDPLDVKVVAGATTVQDLHVTRGAQLKGRVVRPDGSPVAEAVVRTTFGPPAARTKLGVHVWKYESSSMGLHPLTHPSTRTGADGCYWLDGLQPGVHRVEVIAAGLRYDRREEVQLEDGEVTRLEHVLEDAGAIEGIELGAYLGVRRPGEALPRMVAALPRDGRFSFPGLEPGPWQLESVHPEASIKPVPLATVEVVAGRTTWIDLRGVRRPVRIAGRVVGSLGPIANVPVRLRPQRVLTDVAGRFELMRSFAIRREVKEGLRLVVELPEVRSDFVLWPHGSASWEGDVRLGSEALVVRTLGPSGDPAMANLKLRLELDPDPRAEVSLVAVHAELDCADERMITELAPGKYALRVTFESGAVVEQSVVIPAREPLVVRAPATVDLVVVVRNADGTLTRDTHVRVWTWLGPGDPPADNDSFAGAAGIPCTGKTDAEGHARLRGISAGELWISVFGDGKIGGQRLRVDPGGELEIEIVLQSADRR